MQKTYIEWLATETPGCWSVDQASVAANEKAVKMGFDFSAGNPRLTYTSILKEREKFEKDIAECHDMKGDAKAYELYRRYITPCAKVLEPIWEKSGGRTGYQCAMVNPKIGCDVDAMIEAAIMMNKWAPNISVKLPTTGAGITAAEEVIAMGIHVTGTVGFSVSQAMLMAEAHARGIAKAKKNGITPRGGNYALFSSRVDAAVLEVAQDNGCNYIGPEEAKWAGLAVAKRIYELYKSRNYMDENNFYLVPAALSTPFQLSQMAGAQVRFDNYMPTIEALDKQMENTPREYHIDDPIDPVALERLMGLKVFRQMYEYDGLAKNDLISFGYIQNILINFGEAGFQQLLLL